MATTKKPTAPRAEYATKPVTPLMQEYADWLTAQTGYKVDPRSVFLSSALRTTFQAERRETKQAPKPAPKPRAKRGSTVATSEGVVIAEQKHVEAAA